MSVYHGLRLAPDVFVVIPLAKVWKLLLYTKIERMIMYFLTAVTSRLYGMVYGLDNQINGSDRVAGNTYQLEVMLDDNHEFFSDFLY